MLLIKKISVKTVCGDLKVLLRQGKLKDNMLLMRVMGIATGTATGTGDYGSWVAFKGSFEATNMINGIVRQSGRCLLPDVASELLEAAVVQSGVTGVEFAFDITLHFDNTSATGYVFGATPLLTPSANDPLALLKNTVNTNIQTFGTTPPEANNPLTTTPAPDAPVTAAPAPNVPVTAAPASEETLEKQLEAPLETTAGKSLGSDAKIELYDEADNNTAKETDNAAPKPPVQSNRKNAPRKKAASK